MRMAVAGESARTATGSSGCPREHSAVGLHIWSEVHQAGAGDRLCADLVRRRVEPEVALRTDGVTLPGTRSVDIRTTRTLACKLGEVQPMEVEVGRGGGLTGERRLAVTDIAEGEVPCGVGSTGRLEHPVGVVPQQDPTVAGSVRRERTINCRRWSGRRVRSAAAGVAVQA